MALRSRVRHSNQVDNRCCCITGGGRLYLTHTTQCITHTAADIPDPF